LQKNGRHKPTSGNPVLIFTGGTLTSVRDPKTGHVKPDDTQKLRALAQKSGFDLSLSQTPYIIDSIDFNIGIEYPEAKVKYPDYDRLLAATEEVLKHGDTPIICGGSDTEIWYSTLLTKDLMRRGYLQPDSGQKIIFLSSMRTFEKAPELVEKILKAGKLLSAQNVSGGLALSPENEEGTTFSVHDVCNHFDKISPTRIDAFRSAQPVGMIENGKFSENPQYHTPRSFPKSDLRTLARIAPPLIAEQSSKAVLAYMKTIGEAEPPFDGVVIEGIPSNAKDGALLVQMVDWLDQQGVHVMFCNPVRFNGKEMAPVDKDPRWDEKGLTNDLKRAGAQFITAVSKDAYLDMLLTTPRRESNRIAPLHLTDEKTGLELTIPKQAKMEIRYVPDAATMRHTIGKVAEVANKMVLRALTNAVVPDSLLDTARAYSGHGADSKNGWRDPTIRRYFDLTTEYSDLEPIRELTYEAGRQATDYMSSEETRRMRQAAERNTNKPRR
jgi:hypothetical protein